MPQVSLNVRLVNLKDDFMWQAVVCQYSVAMPARLLAEWDRLAWFLCYNQQPNVRQDIV
jgi:hypothetical protein